MPSQIPEKVFEAFIQATDREPTQSGVEDLTPLLNLARQVLGLRVELVKSKDHDSRNNSKLFINYIPDESAGPTIYVCSENEPDSLVRSNLAHEIGHYLVASQEQKRLPNYGLGPSPDDETSDFWDKVYPQWATSCLYGSEIATMEGQASFVGMLIEYLLGYDSAYTYDYHNWNEHGKDSPKKLEGYFQKHYPMVREILGRFELESRGPIIIPHNN
jgi:hypothetical protein